VIYMSHHFRAQKSRSEDFKKLALLLGSTVLGAIIIVALASTCMLVKLTYVFSCI